jgi:hypothetical protein
MRKSYKDRFQNRFFSHVSTTLRFPISGIMALRRLTSTLFANSYHLEAALRAGLPTQIKYKQPLLNTYFKEKLHPS